MAAFLHEHALRNFWLAAALQRGADGKYTGDTFTGTGPSLFNFEPTLAVPIKAGTITAKPGASGALWMKFDLDIPLVAAAHSQRPAAKSSLTVTKAPALTGEVFGYPVPTCGPGGAANQDAATSYQDVWWAYPPDSEPGWDLMISHKGDTLFVAWFTYDEDGHTLWLVFAATKADPGV
jgi:hypothetical protein